MVPQAFYLGTCLVNLPAMVSLELVQILPEDEVGVYTGIIMVENELLSASGVINKTG